MLVTSASLLGALPAVASAAPQRIAAAGVLRGHPVHSGQGSRPLTGRIALSPRGAPTDVYIEQKRAAAARAKADARRHRHVTSPAFGSLAAVFGGLNASGINAAAAGGPTPPDTTGAIGPNDYVETVNSAIAAYDRTSLGLRSAPVDLSTFVGGIALCDPQIKYDTHTSRWFYVAIRCDATGQASGTLYVGFSKTSDPTNLSTAPAGGWCGYGYGGFGAAFEDYPKLGLDGTHIMIGANEFTGSGAFDARIFGLAEPPAGAITTCPAVGPAGLVFGSASSPLMTTVGHVAETPEPAMVADASTGGYLVAADEATPFSGNGANIQVWQMAGSGATPTLASLGAPGVPAYLLPASVPQPAPAPASDVIDTSDSRLTAAIAAIDPGIAGSPETIWTQHAVDSGTGGSVVRWYEIVPGATPSVAQVGSVGDAAGFAFNGAIAPTASGGAVVNYNAGGASQLVGLKAQSRISSAPAGTMNTPVALASSSDFDQDFSCPRVSGQSSPCRWGDYAGASIDPNNPSVVWGTSQVDGTSDGANGAQWVTQNFALTANDIPPTATGTAATPSPVQGQPVSFLGSGSDADGTIASYSWSFGDGSPAGAGATPSHVYAQPGTYTVTLTVTDNGGQTGSSSSSVVVDEAPTAHFVVTTAHPASGVPVHFNGSSSHDADGSITSYSWSFGDGSAGGSGVTPTHRYRRKGTYAVKLTVTDSSGFATSTTGSVKVALAGKITKILRTKANRKGASLQIRLNGPGTLTIGKKRFHIHKAEVFKYNLKLSKNQLHTLDSTHKLKLKLKIKFVPAAGQTFSKTETLKFRF